MTEYTMKPWAVYYVAVDQDGNGQMHENGMPMFYFHPHEDLSCFHDDELPHEDFRVCSSTKDTYDLGYAEGFMKGSGEGYATGLKDGEETGRKLGFNAGHSAGLTEGYASGYASGEKDGSKYSYGEGFGDGHRAGERDGEKAGYAKGHADGKKEGEESGHSEGWLEGRDYAFSEYKRGFTDGRSEGKFDEKVWVNLHDNGGNPSVSIHASQGQAQEAARETLRAEHAKSYPEIDFDQELDPLIDELMEASDHDIRMIQEVQTLTPSSKPLVLPSLECFNPTANTLYGYDESYDLGYEDGVSDGRKQDENGDYCAGRHGYMAGFAAGLAKGKENAP